MVPSPAGAAPALDLRELVEEIVQDADFEAGSAAAVVLAEGAAVPVVGVPELRRRAIESVIRIVLSFTPEGTRVEVSGKLGAVNLRASELRLPM